MHDPADYVQFHQKADAPALCHLLIYTGLIALLVYAVATSLPGWWLALFPLGVLLAFLFNLAHECTHKTAFKTPWLNETVGYLTGFILFQPFIWFRYFHLAHHRYVNDPARDPELIGHPKPDSKFALLIFLSCVLYWRSKVHLLCAHALGTVADNYVPIGVHARLRLEARMYLSVYGGLLVAAILWLPILFWVWFLPLLLGFPCLRLYHLAEHGLCPSAASKLVNTRTVVTNQVVRFVTWNMPFHIEHHLLPGVPFHRLPLLHIALQSQPGTVSKGYLSFVRAYWRSLSA
ncbi:MAG: fatty acid desaturase [Burkholderiaceae bacterium]